MHLLLSVGLAEEPALNPAESAEIAPASAQELLDEGWERFERWDLEGARIVAQQAAERDPARKVDADALIGASWERDEQPERALPIYEALLQADRDSDLAAHLRFRIAECYAATGHPDVALTYLAAVGDPTGMPIADQLKIGLSQGVWQIESGEVDPGLATLGKWLGTAPRDESTWFQARARVAIAEVEIDRALSVEVSGGDRRQKKRIVEVSDHMVAAEDQVAAAIQLKEPEWAIAGLLALGDGFQSVGDVIAHVPPTKKIAKGGPERVAMWNEALESSAFGLYVKSSRYYEGGLEVVTRTGFQGRRVGELQEHLDALHTRVTAIDAPIGAP